MKYFHHITFASGLVSSEGYDATHEMKNPENYFASLGMHVPTPVRATGWPWSQFYIVSGDAENGVAVAWH